MKGSRYLLSGVVLFIGLSTSAFAADVLPRVNPVPYTNVPYNWSGFYVGAHLGGGWGSSQSDLTGYTVKGGPLQTDYNGAFSNNSLSGIVGGGQVGYNYQFGRVVVGLEGDFSWTNMNGTTPCFAVANVTCKDHANWTADLTGRVGYAFDRLLPYIKGGVAWANIDRDLSAPVNNGNGVSAYTASDSSTRMGWLLGAGVEYGITSAISAKLEYNYVMFDNIDLGLDVLNPGGQPTGYAGNLSFKDNMHVFKAGVNYRF